MTKGKTFKNSSYIVQGSNSCLFIAKYKYIVHGWQRGKYINSISVIFVVLTMPLQYVLLMLIGLKRKIKC